MPGTLLISRGSAAIWARQEWLYHSIRRTKGWHWGTCSRYGTKYSVRWHTHAEQGSKSDGGSQPRQATSHPPGEAHSPWDARRSFARELLLLLPLFAAAAARRWRTNFDWRGLGHFFALLSSAPVTHLLHPLSDPFPEPSCFVVVVAVVAILPLRPIIPRLDKLTALLCRRLNISSRLSEPATRSFAAQSLI